MFNPPAAPHFGGFDEILLTALKLVENILNSRKLTPTSEDLTDPECLNPHQLLPGRATPNLPPDVFTEDYLSAKEKLRIAQAVADQFWHRWMKEVLPSLTERELC